MFKASYIFSFSIFVISITIIAVILNQSIMVQKSDVIQSNQVGIEQVLDQEGMSPTPVITKTNKIRILEIPHTCDNSQLFYLSLPAKCLVNGHLITIQQTPNKNMIKIETP